MSVKPTVPGELHILGAYWPDEAVLPASKAVATRDPVTNLVAWETGAGALVGQYVPVTNGDVDDPQPLYILNADGNPIFMMVWVDF